MSGNHKIGCFLASTVSVLLLAQTLSAQEPEQMPRPTFGGPDAVENLIKANRAPRDVVFESSVFDSYRDWQDSIKEEH
jgi:hypothetical protein